MVDLNQYDPGQSSQDAQGDAAGSLLVPLVRSRWLILGGVLIGAAGGIAYGISQPNSYLSIGKLLVRYSAREETTPEAVISGGGGPGAGQSRSLVVNEIALLAVPPVFEATAKQVTPPQIFSSYDPSATDNEATPLPLKLFHRFQAWWFRRAAAAKPGKIGHALDDCPRCVSEAAHTLAQDLGLEAEPESSVITVSYAAQDPELARQVVDAFMTAAEARHRESFNTNSTLEFVSERLGESLSQVQAAEAEFNEYRISCDVSDYDTQRTTCMERVRDLEKEAADGVAALAQMKSRKAILVGLQAEQPATMEREVERPAIENPRWRNLQQRLFALEDSLNVVVSRVGGTTQERENQQALIKKQIEDTRAELKEQPDLVKQTPITEVVPDPRHQRLTQEIDDINQDIAAQESKNDKTVDGLQAARHKLVATEQCEPRYHFLEATAVNAKETYKAFVKAHERTAWMNLLDQVQFSNLRRIQEATVPFEKEGPKRAKFLVVGVLLGALAGSVLGFVRYSIDPHLRSPADVEQLLGVKVVGVTPRSRLSWRLRRAIRRAMRTAAL